MGHSEKALRKLLEQAAQYDDPNFEVVPVKTIMAVQGGGTWSVAAAEAIKVIVPELLKAGSIEAISGTSGGAVNAALTVKALNEGKGAAGVTANLNAFWNKVRHTGSFFSMPRMLTTPFTPTEDRWPNIPQGMITMADLFRHINPMVQFSMATAGLKGMVDSTVGNWNSVQNGPTAIYTNSVRKNVFSGVETYEVATGNAVDGDAIVSSAGLDELGGHLRINELMSARNWMSGNISRHRDGAYSLNPDLGIMLDNHAATDVVVIALHGAEESLNASGKDKLYTHQIHRDLTGLQLDDGRRVNFHVIQITLPGNASSRMNTDPEYLDLLKELGRTQAEAQIDTIRDALGVRSSYQPPAKLVQAMVENKELALT